ncbi:rubredoxin [Gloeomargarita sp.]
MAEPGVAALSRYECRACGYIYEPEQGQPEKGIPPGTAFADLPVDWRCPVCGVKKAAFVNIGTKAVPGFPENYRYGIGVNRLTPGQKSLLIFGGLVLGFLFLMSFYGVK